MSDPPLAEPLLRAILDHPEALEPRLVWADALMGDGDPRGEFVLLQCRQDPTELQRKRATALRRRFGVRWASGLSRLVHDSEVQFELGLMVAATLRRAPHWEQEILEVRPEAALVRRLRLARRHVPEERSLDRVLEQLPGVRVANDLVLTEVNALVAAGAPLVELRLEQRRELPDLSQLSVPGLQVLALPSGLGVGPVLGLLDRHPSLNELDVGFAELLTWRPVGVARSLRALTVKVVGWSLRASGEGLRHLDAWYLPHHRDRPLRGLTRQLAELPIDAFDFIHVRGGRTPERSDLVDLQRAAQGTPILLPAQWRRVLVDDR